MAKKKRRPGWALFLDRMKREGRYSEYQVHYDRFIKENIHFKTASYKACVEMGYENAEKEREIQADWLEVQERRLAKEEAKREKEEAKRLRDEEMAPARLQREQLDLLDALGETEVEIDTSILPDDIAWVYQNLHKCKGQEDEWLVLAEDASHPGAWNMLVWAVGNQTEFMKTVIRSQMKHAENVQEDLSMRSVERSIEEIDKMIAAIV